MRVAAAGPRRSGELEHKLLGKGLRTWDARSSASGWRYLAGRAGRVPAEEKRVYGRSPVRSAGRPGGGELSRGADLPLHERDKSTNQSRPHDRKSTGQIASGVKLTIGRPMIR